MFEIFDIKQLATHKIQFVVTSTLKTVLHSHTHTRKQANFQNIENRTLEWADLANLSRLTLK